MRHIGAVKADVLDLHRSLQPMLIKERLMFVSLEMSGVNMDLCWAEHHIKARRIHAGG